MNPQADAEALGLQVMHIRIMPVCASTVVLTHAHMLKRQPCAVNKISTAAPNGNNGGPSGIQPGASVRWRGGVVAVLDRALAGHWGSLRVSQGLGFEVNNRRQAFPAPDQQQSSAEQRGASFQAPAD